MDASRKKSFHISVKSHNAEIKLYNLYHFTEEFKCIASYNIIFPSFVFHHLTINCIWLMLFLHERKQALVLVKQLTSASSIETFLSTRYYSCGSSFSHSIVCKQNISSKHLNAVNKVFHLARCATQDLYRADAHDINESQS